MTISNIQARSARAILGLDAKEVSQATRISISPLYKFETEGRGLSSERVAALEKFYESRGIEFLDYNGTRQKPEGIVSTLNGRSGFKAFLDDVYDVAKNQGGEICIFNIDARHWVNWMGPEDWAAHVDRMEKIKDNITDKILIKEGDWFFPADSFAEYRWFPEELFNDQTLYAYGDKLAFMTFTAEDVEILVLKKAEFNQGFRVLFNIAWDKIAKIPTKNT